MLPLSTCLGGWWHQSLSRCTSLIFFAPDFLVCQSPGCRSGAAREDRDHGRRRRQRRLCGRSERVRSAGRLCQDDGIRMQTGIGRVCYECAVYFVYLFEKCNASDWASFSLPLRVFVKLRILRTVIFSKVPVHQLTDLLPPNVSVFSCRCAIVFLFYSAGDRVAL